MNRSTRTMTVLLSVAFVGLACEGARDAGTSSEGRHSDTPALAATTAAVAEAAGADGKRATKRGFVQNIESMTEENLDFRRVVYTAKHAQLVLMSLPPDEHIGMEKHDVDQFFRIESGNGEVVIDGKRSSIGPGSAIVVPAGANHDVINKGEVALKLYTVYAPPNHRDGVVHHTRADAERDAERFDGKTTE